MKQLFVCEISNACCFLLEVWLQVLHQDVYGKLAALPLVVHNVFFELLVLGYKLLKHRPLWLCKCFVNFGIKFYFLKLTQDPDELFKCHQLSLKVEDDFFLFLLFDFGQEFDWHCCLAVKQVVFRACVKWIKHVTWLSVQFMIHRICQ